MNNIRLEDSFCICICIQLNSLKRSCGVVALYCTEHFAGEPAILSFNCLFRCRTWSRTSRSVLHPSCGPWSKPSNRWIVLQPAWKPAKSFERMYDSYVKIWVQSHAQHCWSHSNHDMRDVWWGIGSWLLKVLLKSTSNSSIWKDSSSD